MNVLFKCFKCKGKIRKEIHSYTWNKKKEPEKISKLCDHFSEIELYWETKYGFFTVGWKVKIYNVSVNIESPKYYKKLPFKQRIVAILTYKKMRRILKLLFNINNRRKV